MVLTIIILVQAHKDAAVSSSISSDYKISFGLIPGQLVENKVQTMFVKIENIDDNSLATDLNVEFSVYKDTIMASDAKPEFLKGKYLGEQKESGVYSTKFIFKEKGNYLIITKLFQNDVLVTEVTKNVSVEPNGPTKLFWYFMLGAILVGGFIASKSHKW